MNSLERKAIRQRQRCTIWAIGPLLLFGSLTLAKTSKAADHTEDIIDVLIKYKLTPTTEGLTPFFERVAKGEFGPLPDKEIDKAIAALGSNSYVRRVRASRKLTQILFPPIQKLKKAAKEGDLETQLRVRKLLQTTSSKQHPFALLFELMESRKIRIAPTLLIQCLERCEDEGLLFAGQKALLATLKDADLSLSKKWMNSENPQRQATGLRVLGALKKEKAIPELTKWLKKDNSIVRTGAIRALVSVAPHFELTKYTKGLEGEILALVYREAIATFQRQHQKPVETKDLVRKYVTLTEKYAELLSKMDSVEVKKRGRLSTNYWINLKLDTSKHPEIVLYRIKWFNGRWSQWFTPGYNDRHTSDNRKIRMWALFNDHSSEVIIAKDRNFYRKKDNVN
ncbi:MAG: HEAT repeat domain-containing protein [Gemmataceae bacterium]